MALFVWNVRGFNKEGRRQDVLHHLQSLSPSFVALIETKVKVGNLQRLANCVPVHWNSCHNFSPTISGRIWITWNPQIWTCAILLVLINRSLYQYRIKGDYQVLLL